MYYIIYIYKIVSFLKLFQTNLLLFVLPFLLLGTDFPPSSPVGIFSTFSCFPIHSLCIVLFLSKAPPCHISLLLHIEPSHLKA